MDKNKKRTLTAGLAFALLAGAGSLAYFTDRVEESYSAQAGTVVLGGIEEQVGVTNMAPGDIRDFNVKSEYLGSLDAKVRIRFKNTDALTKPGDSNENEGFALYRDEVMISPDDKIELGVLSAGTPIDVPLQIKLGEESDNYYQDNTVQFDYVIEALQDSHTGENWELVDEGTIDIVPHMP